MTMTNRFAWLLSAVTCALPAGCADDTCSGCDAPERTGSVATLELDEASGVVASAALQDVVYAHNDKGDSSRLFAMGIDGEDLGTFDVEDAANEDWEDISRGPCEAGTCLYVADIGDNDRERSSYSIYFVPEPDAVGPGEHTLVGERIEFTYDAPHNAEVLLVHPETGAITIVTKEDEGPAAIYELPLPLVGGQSYVAAKVGELDPPEGRSRFTSGAVHPHATSILMRTNSRLFRFSMTPSQTVADALGGEPCQLPIADEEQGEAVTWLGGGERILTLGEGLHPHINVSDCRLEGA